MAAQQVASELERKLEGFIAEGKRCMLVVNGVQYKNKDIFKKTNPGLVWIGERDPRHWGSFGSYHFPNLTEYSRQEIARLLEYERAHPEQNIQIDLLSEEKYEQEYERVRSAYGA